MAPARVLIPAAALALLAGCGGGGGGGGGPTVGGTAPSVSLSVAWPSRSRALSGLASALSATVSLSHAAMDGSDASVLVPRRADPPGYISSTTIPGPIRVGAWQLVVQFYAQNDGSGSIVGTADTEVRVQPDGTLAKVDGTALGTIQTLNRIAAVSILPGQAVTLGIPTSLAYTAKDASNNVLAVSLGSAFFRVASGGNALSVDPDGTCHGVGPGTARVIATIDGVSSDPQSVLVQGDVRIAFLNLQANDLAYDPLSGRLFASVSSTDTSGHGNSIVAINPQTQAITASVVVGSEPGRIALSDDGQFLYVGLRGTGGVVRVDLQTMTVSLRYSLGSDPYYGPKFVGDMTVIPGSPHALVVSLSYRKDDPTGFLGLSIYDDGVERPKSLPQSSAYLTPIDAIAFGASPTRLYGYDESDTAAALTRMSIDATGISVADTPGKVNYGGPGPIVYSGGLLYSANGQVADPEALKLAGTFDLGLSRYGVSMTEGVAIDAKANLAYFTVSKNAAATISLMAFNRSTYVPVSSRDIPVAKNEFWVGQVPRLVLCGSGTLAFNTHGMNSQDNAQVVFVTTLSGP